MVRDPDEDDSVFAALLASPVDFSFRGFPREGSVPLGRVADQGWNVFAPPMSMPLMVLKRPALENNLDAMSEFCQREGVELAPHGKTHMSPQLWREQERRGAWAVTVATSFQGEVFRRFGARRILVANEMVTPADLDWVAECRERDPECEIYLLVDSAAAVEALEIRLERSAVQIAQPVLIELGHPGGRAGVRTREEAVLLAERIASCRLVRLAGIEGYEGAVPGEAPRGGEAPAEDSRSGEAPRDSEVPGDREAPPSPIVAQDRAIRHYLGFVKDVVVELAQRGALPPGGILSMGGSRFFGTVVHELGHGWAGRPAVRVVLRSGCYLTHDHGMYAAAFDEPTLFESVPRPSLRPALEVWGSVLSTPEPDLAIVGFGRRDVPYDAGLPRPLRMRRDGAFADVAGALVVERLNDQHAFVRSRAPESGLRVGDLLGAGISHPCTAFDKWRLLPVVSDAYDVVGAVRTFF